MEVSWPLKGLNVIYLEEKVKPLYIGHLLITDTFLRPSGVRYRQVSLYDQFENEFQTKSFGHLQILGISDLPTNCS